MNIQVILTPVVGAAIGYATNWLAIKMLFRPYTPKSFLSIPIPFTPGLIPKERERIANKIGLVMEEYLLTEEVIINELSSDSNQEHVADFFERKLYNEKGNIECGKFLSTKDQDSLWIMEELEQIIVDNLLKYMEDEETQKVMTGLITNKVCEELKQITVRDLFDDSIESIQQVYENLLRSEQLHKSIKGNIVQVLQEKQSLSNILGPKVVSSIQSLIAYHLPSIINHLKHILENETFEGKVKEIIEETVQNKLGALGAMFMNVDSLYETIVEKADEKLDDEDIRSCLLTYFNDQIDDFTTKGISTVLPDDRLDEIILHLLDSMMNMFTTIKVNELALGYVDDSSLFEGLNKLTGDEIEKRLSIFINEKYKALVQQESVKKMLTLIVKTNVEKLTSYEVDINAQTKLRLRNFIINKYKLWIKRHVKDFIKTVEVGRIIEQQLNTFDTKTLEEIILSIAKKELRAITWLGGFLGFVISLILLIVK